MGILLSPVSYTGPFRIQGHPTVQTAHCAVEKSHTNATNVTDASAHAYNLKTHLIMNTGEKSNECIQCDYASSEASKLVRHLKTHTGEKSDKCNQ